MTIYFTKEDLRGIQERNHKASDAAQEVAASWAVERADAHAANCTKTEQALLHAQRAMARLHAYDIEAAPKMWEEHTHEEQAEKIAEYRKRTAAEFDAMFPPVAPPAPDEMVALQLEVSRLKIEVEDLITTCETMRHRLGAHGQQIIDLENLTEKQAYGRS